MTTVRSSLVPVSGIPSRLLDSVFSVNRIHTARRYAIIACSIVACVTGWYNWNWNEDLWQSLLAMPWGRPLFILSFITLSVFILEMVWRIVLVIRYKAVDSVDDSRLPSCTVIVPAYNEGAQVLETLKSLSSSDYPREKLQIIAVDDGSQDDTWEWIKRARTAVNGRLHAVKLARNMGKRHALYHGFKKSTGEILVTVDSDSVVERDTLRNLVSPFVTDANVGGIAGNVRVLNRDKGMIPKMLDVIFVFSFDFMRASQSMVKAVMCTPGALSAYRRRIVMTVAREWRDQTFLGQPANIGEDRALTNLVLRQGHDVLFQKNALVRTEVPTSYSNLCRMFLRWNRSNIRENIAMTRFVFKRFRRDNLTGTRINLTLGWLTFFLAPIFIAVTWGLMIWEPVFFGTNVLISIVIFSSIPAGFFGWKHNSFLAFWSYAYGFFWFIALIWILPYSMMTPHNSGWLTRQIKPRSKFRIVSFRRQHFSFSLTGKRNEVRS